MVYITYSNVLTKSLRSLLAKNTINTVFKFHFSVTSMKHFTTSI